MHDLDGVSLQREGEFEGESFEFEGEPPLPPLPPPDPPPPYPPYFRSLFDHHHHRRHHRHHQHEAEVTERAAELLTLSSEQELEGFLDGVINAVKGAIDSPTGQSIIQALKPIAKQIIPAATSALGGALGGLVSAGAGTPIGNALGGAAGNAIVSALGLELEGLSMEDRELEVAKQFVRLASATAENAAGAPPQVPRHEVARVLEQFEIFSTALTQRSEHGTGVWLAGLDGE